MGDRRTFINRKATREDLFRMMRKYVGRSADHLRVYQVDWSDGSCGWLVELGNDLYDVQRLKDVIRGVLVVGERHFVIGVI